VPAQVDEQPGRDGVELPDMTEGEGPQERAERRGARTPMNSRFIAPCLSTAMSSMLSAPAIIPATPRWDLQAGVSTAGLVDPDMLLDKVLQRCVASLAANVALAEPTWLAGQ
jgi:hypothetical protein